MRSVRILFRGYTKRSKIIIWGYASTKSLRTLGSDQFVRKVSLVLSLYLTFWKAKSLGLGVSICLDMVSIETFGLDSSKNDISTVGKVLTVQKMTSQHGLCLKISIINIVSISTFQKPMSRPSRKSLKFEKQRFNMLRHLDLGLDCSRLSWPPGLRIISLAFPNLDYPYS
jgi:hypothetical protein